MRLFSQLSRKLMQEEFRQALAGRTTPAAIADLLRAELGTAAMGT